MRKITTVLLFTLLLSFSIFAQDEDEKEKIECPDVSITGPASTVAPGEVQTFALTISGGDVDEADIKIEWSVENGEIVDGQGTKTLSVINKNGDEVTTVTANVDAGEDCKVSLSETGVTVCPPESRLIDEFGKTANGDIKARIDAYLVELENNPNAQGYIINYGPKRDIAGREKLIRNYINMRRFDVSRITYVNGGVEKEIRTRVWIVPSGADVTVID